MTRKPMSLALGLAMLVGFGANAQHVAPSSAPSVGVASSKQASQPLTLGAALEITIPTGEYDATRLANTSNNFYTYKPLFSFTWLPSARTELSVKTTYSFNQENHDTDYRSGQIFHFDYSASYKVTDNLNLGINGYYFEQLSNHRANGVELADSRERVLGIGPGLMWRIDPKKALWINAYTESMARNRAASALNLQVRTVFAF